MQLSSPLFLRGLKWAFVTLAVVVAAYPIGGNLFLRLGGVEYAFASTEHTKVRFDSAWTLWPGTVHVSKLWLMIKDYNVQCVVQVDEAEIDLALWDLAQRKFHATRVRASGVSIRARHRVHADQLTEEFVSALPELPGVSEPPVFIGDPPPPIPDSEYDLWTVQLDDVDALVHEMWIQQARYEGKGRARGAFELKPARKLWVGPARLELDAGSVSMGAYRTLEHVTGTISTTIVPFDVRPPKGLEMLKFVTARVTLKADVINADAVRLFSDTDMRADLADSQTKLSVDVAIDHEQLRVGSQIKLAGKELRVGNQDVDASLPEPWSLVATVQQEDSLSTRLATLSATGARIRIVNADMPDAPLFIANAQGSARSSTTQLTDTWELRDADLLLGQMRVPKLRALNRVLPVSPDQLRFVDGSARLRAQMHYSTAKGVEHATVDAHLDNANALIDTARIHASGHVKAEIRHPLSARGSVKAQLSLNDVTIDLNGKTAAQQECSYFHAAAVQGDIDTTVRHQQPYAGNAALTMDDVLMRWGDFNIEGDAKVTVDLTRRETSEHRTLTGSVDARDLRMMSGVGAPENWEASSNTLRARVSFEVPDGDLLSSPLQGSMLVHAPQFQAHVGTLAMRARMNARFQVDALRLDRRSATLQGRAAVTRGAILNDDDPEHAGWWARIALHPSTINAYQNLDLESDVSVKMRDGTPMLLMLAERGDLPAWLPDVVTLDQIESELHVSRRCRFTDMQIRHARGGGLSLTGRLHNVPGRTTGALQAEVSGFDVLSLGVVLTENGSDLELFATDGWITKQQMRLQTTSVLRLHQPVCAAAAETCS